MQVKLCGHGTLAAAHALFTSGLVDTNCIEFVTLSGILSARKVLENKSDGPDNQNGEAQDCFLIELNFPMVPLIDFNSAEASEISNSLNGASFIDIKRTTTENDLFVMPAIQFIIYLLIFINGICIQILSKD